MHAHSLVNRRIQIPPRNKYVRFHCNNPSKMLDQFHVHVLVLIFFLSRKFEMFLIGRGLKEDMQP